MRRLRFRAAHKAFAQLMGYFWHDCPRCGQPFGGHEKGWGIPRHWPTGSYKGMCPECVAISEEEKDPQNDKYWQDKLKRSQQGQYPDPQVKKSI